ncbi:MAG: hypothetical protein ACP5EK_04845, partial [Thermoplasmatota archaeon]
FSPADYYGSLILCVPSGFRATAGQTQLEGTWSEGRATVDLEAHGLSLPAGETLTVEVGYPLPRRLEYVVQYPTAVFTITLDTPLYPRATLPLAYHPESGLYQGTLHNLTAGREMTVSLLEAEGGGGEPGPLTWAMGGAVGVLLLLLLLVLRRGGRRSRHLEKEPVEALELRRRLLTDALKTLEVEHDRKAIPDAYYQSIKKYFKQEAVEVLRELDRRR